MTSIRLYGMSDDELERLKRKKMQEMQRRMAVQQANQAAQATAKEKPKGPTTDQILDGIFGDRAWEVWKAAREQFPKVIPQVERALVDAVKQGKIGKKIRCRSIRNRPIKRRMSYGTRLRWAKPLWIIRGN